MPSTNATRKFLKTLDQAMDGWKGVQPWGVAFSGGRDSSVLLWGLVQVAGPQNLRALHVDHGWRPEPERLAEAESVGRWCSRLGVALTRFAAPQVAIDSEDSARSYRYRCFAQFLAEYPNSPVVLAHHADDQAETILMRILRGRSWQGLGGMRSRRGRFLRPLLNLRSLVLADVAREQNIPWISDSTNNENTATRNFLRNEVFPLLNTRFPRSVEALNDLGSAWRQLLPAAEPDPAWVFDAKGACLPVGLWSLWNTLVRQSQLLAVATRVETQVRFSRRFLETIAVNPPPPSRAGSGWRWRLSAGFVVWARVVQQAPKEYFVRAEQGVVCDLGSHRMVWSRQETQLTQGEWVFVPGIDPERSFVWRSVVPGMTLVSASDGVWTRVLKRRRLGRLTPDRCSLIVQEGFVKAVVDPREKRVVWAETPEEKLNKTGIFVKLLRRSDYER